MTLELRILLCSFTVTMPLLLLHYRSDPTYRISKTCGYVGVALYIAGIYQIVTGVMLACREFEMER